MKLKEKEWLGELPLTQQQVHHAETTTKKKKRLHGRAEIRNFSRNCFCFCDILISPRSCLFKVNFIKKNFFKTSHAKIPVETRPVERTNASEVKSCLSDRAQPAVEYSVPQGILKMA